MDYIAILYQVQNVYESIAKELYTLALNIYGNKEDALQATGDAFVKAYIKASANSDVLDSEQIKLLSIKLLYKCGYKGFYTRNKLNKHHERLSDNKNKFFLMLRQLSYSERFIFLLFCRYKLQEEQISELLSLPKFLVTRWLLSAAHKINLCNQTNNERCYKQQVTFRNNGRCSIVH